MKHLITLSLALSLGLVCAASYAVPPKPPTPPPPQQLQQQQVDQQMMQLKKMKYYRHRRKMMRRMMAYKRQICWYEGKKYSYGSVIKEGGMKMMCGVDPRAEMGGKRKKVNLPVAWVPYKKS